MRHLDPLDQIVPRLAVSPRTRFAARLFASCACSLVLGGFVATNVRAKSPEKVPSPAPVAAESGSAQFSSAAFRARLKNSVEADYKQNLGPLFRYFHENPELSFREYNTSARLAKELRALGVDVTEKVGGTGVVGLIRNGAGPVVLIRADMDGLPVLEASGLPIASKIRQVDVEGVEQPVMHACGHDAHITALVGTARFLTASKDQWRGTVVLVGQPAEERIGGARRMIEDGLFTRFPKPDYALALHVNSLIEAGKIQVQDNLAYSSSDSVDILVHGIGAHGAAPHRGLDPILIASQIVVSLQSLVSRSIDPLQPGVVTVGSIHGGTKHNIIPDSVKMQLTIRSDDLRTRQILIDGVRRIAKGTAIAMGVPDNLLPEVTQNGESTPPTMNDAATVARVRQAFEQALGADRISHQPRQGMGAEDFAYFVAPEHGIKGVYFNVGATMAADLPNAASHHSPLFKISAQPAIETSVEAMSVAALSLLAPAS